MVILGLTGSIGMGKTTTARLFAEAGVAVHDSDAAVHELYAGPGSQHIEAEFPGTACDGHVDRRILSQRVLGNDHAMRRLESVVHPYVAQHREAFIVTAQARGDKLIVLDVPLLFEISGERNVDAVIVASAPKSLQKSRVLMRPGMTAEKFEALLAKQTPDVDKRRRAHYVIDTAHGISDARRQVMDILKSIAHMQQGREGRFQ